jgi:hypothetical protein
MLSFFGSSASASAASQRLHGIADSDPNLSKSDRPLGAFHLRKQSSLGILSSKEQQQLTTSNPQNSLPISFQLEDYDMGPCIGQGSSALVFFAKHIPTQTTVSVKVIDLDMFERNQIDELRVSSSWHSFYFKKKG